MGSLDSAYAYCLKAGIFHFEPVILGHDIIPTSFGLSPALVLVLFRHELGSVIALLLVQRHLMGYSYFHVLPLTDSFARTCRKGYLADFAVKPS